MIRVRTSAEIKQALAIQIKALEASCAAFDSGEKWEGIRIATAVHTIVHDASKKNKSLLSLMQAKAGLLFAASGHPIAPENLIVSHSLVILEVGGQSSGYVAPLGDRPYPIRWVAFSKWWDEPIFSSGSNRNLLTRKNLVFGLRNKDGGGHYDHKLHDEDYVAMADGEFWRSKNHLGEERVLRDLELTSMRQIGWEVTETLKNGGLY